MANGKSAGDKYSGGCMCGAIRYELRTRRPWSTYCHCESCRKHTGAPVAGLVAGVPEDVIWVSGERALYESTPGRYRGFCRDCGTSLTWEAQLESNWLGLHIGTFDDPEALPPVDHVFCDDAIAWVNKADELPKFNGPKYIKPADVTS